MTEAQSRAAAHSDITGRLQITAKNIVDGFGWRDAPNADEIVWECLEIAQMLVHKNKAYGDSALNPLRVFSKASDVEQICVRLDDKISRLKRGKGEETEDVEADILGYLMLLRIAKKRLVGAALRQLCEPPAIERTETLSSENESEYIPTYTNL